MVEKEAPEQIVPQEENIKKNNKKLKISILIVLIFILLIFIISSFFLKSEVMAPNSLSAVQKKVEEAKKIFSFHELTIPYLRERNYESRLGELRNLSSSANYASHLTNYDSDGLRINGLLTIPTGSQPQGGFPAIIFIHGYIPPANYQTLSSYSDYVDFLARSGFVVFKIDLRGHGNSEGDPSGAYYSGDYIVDTLNAYAALENAEFVNPKKIGIWGHSMAGNVAARTLAAKPEIPAIVIWAGAVYTYTDFSEYRISDESYRPPPDNSSTRERRNELFETHGSFDPENEFWKMVPMTNYLKDIKGAIQLNHAINDNVVSIEYSRNLNSILDDTNIVHELNEYSGGGHNIMGSHFNVAMENTVRFFTENLK